VRRGKVVRVGQPTRAAAPRHGAPGGRAAMRGRDGRLLVCGTCERPRRRAAAEAHRTCSGRSEVSQPSGRSAHGSHESKGSSSTRAEQTSNEVEARGSRLGDDDGALGDEGAVVRGREALWTGGDAGPVGPDSERRRMRRHPRRRPPEPGGSQKVGEAIAGHARALKLPAPMATWSTAVQRRSRRPQCRHRKAER